MAAVVVDGLRLQDQRLIEIGWNVLQGLLLFLVVLVIARLVRMLATRAMARQNVRTDAAALAARVIYVSLLGIGVFLFATTALGSAAVGLTGVLVAVFVTSLGLQDLFKNYVSGFYVVMERNIKVGDLVDTGTFKGVVTEVNMRVTYMRGEEDQLIVVPNSELFTKILAVSPPPPDWGSGAKGAEDHAGKGLEPVSR